jgi:GNAT superfamily N-acetyltransferase
MRVRLATEGDVQAVVHIAQKVVPLMQGSNNFQWDDSYPTEEHFLVDLQNSHLWVVTDTADTVIGFGALTTAQPEEYAQSGCDISKPSIVPHRMAVDPSAQRCGAAKLLFDKAEDLAREMGYQFVRVDTNTCNIAMQKLIQKSGFSLKGEISLDGKSGSLRYFCYEKSI